MQGTNWGSGLQTHQIPQESSIRNEANAPGRFVFGTRPIKPSSGILMNAIQWPVDILGLGPCKFGEDAIIESDQNIKTTPPICKSYL
jgi:hypothetical protein